MKINRTVEVTVDLTQDEVEQAIVNFIATKSKRYKESTFTTEIHGDGSATCTVVDG